MILTHLLVSLGFEIPLFPVTSPQLDGPVADVLAVHLLQGHSAVILICEADEPKPFGLLRALVSNHFGLRK